MNFRKMEALDAIKVKECNMHCLPEGYITVRDWQLVLLGWPRISYVAEDEGGKIVGCCFCMIYRAEGESEVNDAAVIWDASIDYMFVSRKYRRSGIAERLMASSIQAISDEYPFVNYIILHVRATNRAALALYEKMKFVECARRDSVFPHVGDRRGGEGEGEDQVEMRREGPGFGRNKRMVLRDAVFSGPIPEFGAKESDRRKRNRQGRHLTAISNFLTGTRRRSEQSELLSVHKDCRVSPRSRFIQLPPEQRPQYKYVPHALEADKEDVMRRVGDELREDPDAVNRIIEEILNPKVWI